MLYRGLPEIPFYQIYEGRGAAGFSARGAPPTGGPRIDWAARAWSRTQTGFVSVWAGLYSGGAVMPLDEWTLFALSDRHGFVIASGRCYSEIYFRDEPPLGWSAARRAASPATTSGNLVAFTSLSSVQQRARGCARASSDAALMLNLLALPHLPRQRHEPGGADAKHRRLGRRDHVVSQPRLVPPQIRSGRRFWPDVLDVRLPDAGST